MSLVSNHQAEDIGLGSIFSSSVRKYRKSYCNHVGGGIAQMLKFLEVLYLLNGLID